MKNKAVVLGVNYYIGLSVIRCLGIEGVEVIAVDYSWRGTYGFHSKYCSKALVAPHYKKAPLALINFLIDLAVEESNPPVLIPCADPYVELLDKYLTTLREYYLIPPIEQGLYTKVMNKGSLHNLAREKGVAVPETIYLDEDNYLSKVENYIGYPCLVKPMDSHAFVREFRQKMVEVNNQTELMEAAKKAKNKNLEVLIQRIIPGFDDHMFTFDAYLNNDSKVTHWITCQKLRQYPINYGASVYAVQRYVPELYEIGTSFLESIRFKGFAEIEFKQDISTGRFYLIEVNVRTTNLNSLIYETGINMPYLTYREMTGDTVYQFKEVTYDTGRAFWYAFEDFLALKDYIKNDQLTLIQAISSFFRPKSYAIWDWKDPKPVLVFLFKIFGQVSRKLIRIFSRRR